MKAISLHQPWASLLAAGRKAHETRHWPAPQGMIGQPLIIHAAKKPVGRALHDDLHALCMDEFGCSYHKALPLGALVCVGVLTYSKRMTDVAPRDDDDRVAGGWSPERYAWRIDQVRELDAAIPYIGRQGFFDVPMAFDGATLIEQRSAA